MNINLSNMPKTSTSNKHKIDAEKYVNIDTGETLASEQGVITSINKPNKDYVKFKSDSFYIIEDKAIRYLERVLSKPDMAHVHVMIKMAYGNYNYLHDANLNAHSRKTLQKDLEIARTSFSGLMNRLMRKGVIMETRGFKNDKPFKYIMLNPNLARRTNTIHTECANKFQTFD